MINLWDFDTGMENISEYLDYADGVAKQGALIAIGLMNLGIRDEVDPAKAILEDNITDSKAGDFGRYGGIIGLGFAYAGSCRDDLIEVLLPYLFYDATESGFSVEMQAMTALSMGLIFCGSGN